MIKFFDKIMGIELLAQYLLTCGIVVNVVTIIAILVKIIRVVGSL